MGPVLYWVLFCVLLSLLAIFISCIVFNVVFDYCLIIIEDTSERDEEKRKFRADKLEGEFKRQKINEVTRDVEDLTRIEGDFKTRLPNLTFTNEVDGENGLLVKQKQEYAHTVLPHISEESSLEVVTTNDSSSSNNKGETSKAVKKEKPCDPRDVDSLTSINNIQEKAKRLEVEVDYFAGGLNNVQFYELNENLLRLMIALCAVTWVTEDVRKKKADTLEYIENLQKKLKDKTKH